MSTDDNREDIYQSKTLKFARLYKNDGLYSEAIKAYNKFINMTEENIDFKIYKELIVCYSFLGNDLMAIKTLEKIKGNFQNVVELYYLLGQLYEQSGNMDKAIENFEKTLEINNEMVSVNYHLGDLYFDKKQYKKAENNWLKVIELEPSNAFAKLKLGCYYFNISKYDKALLYLEEPIKKGNKNKESLYALGMIYDKYGREEEAKKIFEELAKRGLLDYKEYKSYIKLLSKEEIANEKLALAKCDNFINRNTKLAAIYKYENNMEIAKQLIEELFESEKFSKVSEFLKDEINDFFKEDK